MTDDLLKSVRDVKACGKHRSSFGQNTQAITKARICDDCLRLVLAHCGEKAVEEVEGRTSLFICNDRIARKGAYQVADAIRRVFGVKAS